MKTDKKAKRGWNWPKPEPLQRPFLKPSQYPLGALGPVLAPAARAIASTVQAPEAIVGQSLLAAASLVTQAHRDVKIDGRIYPTSSFFISVADSGERKTAVDRIALHPLELHERRSERDHAQRVAEWNKTVKSYDALYLKAKRKSKASARNKALEAQGERPAKPVAPIYRCQDPTIEGLFKVLQWTPYSSIHSDEGGRFLGGYAMKDDQRLNTLAALSSLWDTGRLDHIRASAPEPIVLTGRRFSMHIMLQWIVAQRLLSDRLSDGQGFLSRCLVTHPESRAGTREYVPQDVTRHRDVKQYSARLDELLRRPLRMTQGLERALDPSTLTLTTKAKKLWVDFHNKVEKDQLPGRRWAKVRFASKAAEHALRLAGVLAVVRDPDTKCIGKKTLRSALRLTKYYLGEAKRLFGVSAPDQRLELAQKTLEFLQRKKPQDEEDGFRLSFVYQQGPAGVRDAGKARQIIQTLINHGWARKTVPEGEWFQVRRDIRAVSN